MTDRPVETVHVPDEPASDGTSTQRVADLPRLGRFQTLGELGAGAMGIVYRAHDDTLGRGVAIKVLSGRSTTDVRERFLREAKAIGAVPHPNILAIFDAATEGGTPYLVMELAAGGSLRDQLRAGPLPVEAVRQLGIQIARGLAAAHAAKILHRDVKPGNILAVSPGVWKLADFGIARTPDSTLTAGGQFLGSPAYAAPESLRAGEFSPASDVYGLAATLYEALTRAPPHGLELASTMRKLVEDPPPLRIGDALAHAIMAGLARDPAQRPTADQLAHLLATGEAHGYSAAGFGSTEPRAPSATQVPLREPRDGAADSRRTLAIVAIAAAAVAAVVVIVALVSRARTLDRIDRLTDPQTIGTPDEAPTVTPEVTPRIDPDVTPPAADDVTSRSPEPVSAAATVAGCATFSSDKNSATWSDCPDEVLRKIVCKPFVRELSCDCFEDGVEVWFFSAAQMPDFTSAKTASRIARTNCKRGFGN